MTVLYILVVVLANGAKLERIGPVSMCFGIQAQQERADATGQPISAINPRMGQRSHVVHWHCQPLGGQGVPIS